MKMPAKLATALPGLSGRTTLAQVAVPVGAPVPLDVRLARLGRRGLWIIGIWLALFVAWSTFAPISGGVVAQGLVKVEANRRTVTHRDGGTVARIRVREGQLVQRGDVLIELEDVRVEASVDMLRAQQAADLLRQSRLEAEVVGAKQWQPPPQLMTEYAGVKGLAEQARKERAAFDARQTNLAAQIEGERRQAQDTKAEIDVRLRERENSGKALSLMKEELSINQKLEEEHFVNRARVITLQRGVTEYESRSLDNEAELSQARQRLGALESRMRALRDTQIQQASEELREVGARLEDTAQRLRSSTDDQSRQKVLAPESGRLVSLRVNTPGSALGPREPIVDIVPKDAPLIVEAQVPLDVGAQVKPGTPAELRLSTAFARYEKLLPAEVIQVSADALKDERSGGAYLSVQLQVPADALAQSSTPLQPGMAAEVYIKVAERTPIGFLIEPVAGYFRRAFREH